MLPQSLYRLVIEPAKAPDGSDQLAGLDETNEVFIFEVDWQALLGNKKQQFGEGLVILDWHIRGLFLDTCIEPPRDLHPLCMASSMVSLAEAKQKTYPLCVGSLEPAVEFVVRGVAVFELVVCLAPNMQPFSFDMATSQLCTIPCMGGKLHSRFLVVRPICHHFCGRHKEKTVAIP